MQPFLRLVVAPRAASVPRDQAEGRCYSGLPSNVARQLADQIAAALQHHMPPLRLSSEVRPSPLPGWELQLPSGLRISLVLFPCWLASPSLT